METDRRLARTRISVLKKELRIIEKSLIEHLFYISYHLEFFSGRAQNHILNNARALYLGGQLMGLPEVAQVGRILFKSQTDKLIGLDGFLLEGSSHYQLLLTRTYTEIWWCARVTEDLEFLGWVEDYVKKKNDLVRNAIITLSQDVDTEIKIFGEKIDIAIKNIEKEFQNNVQDLNKLIITEAGLDF